MPIFFRKKVTFFSSELYFGYFCVENQCITHQNFFIMPVQKVSGGYRWGQTGKVYPTKAQAEAQGRAIHASGYREKATATKKK